LLPSCEIANQILGEIWVQNNIHLVCVVYGCGKATV
jgi:hypothetical protein